VTILTTVLIASTLVPGAGFRKPPYLVYTGESAEVMIRWQADATPSVGASLSWGATPACTDGRAQVDEEGAGADQHLFSYTLAGLHPRQQLHYRVELDDEVLSGDLFAAPSASASHVALYAYGDTRHNVASHDAVARAISRHMDADPANLQTLLLHTGDWVDEGDLEGYWDAQFFGAQLPGLRGLIARLPVLGCRGNHDGERSLLAKYWPYPFASAQAYEAYYAFDYGPLHVTVVDQLAPFAPGTPQHRWIDQDLAATTRPWKLVLLHRPPFGGAGYHPDDVETQEHLVPLFERHGVAMVLAGHNHYYARAEVNGVQYVTTAGGGASLYPADDLAGVEVAESVFHFVHLTINDTVMGLQAIRLDGSLIEHQHFSQPRPGSRAADPGCGCVTGSARRGGGAAGAVLLGLLLARRCRCGRR